MAYVNVGTDGKAPSTAKVGDIVKTDGGGFISALVTDTGSFMSNLTKSAQPSITKTIQQTKTGGSNSASAVEPWQVNMQKTYDNKIKEVYYGFSYN